MRSAYRQDKRVRPALLTLVGLVLIALLDVRLALELIPAALLAFVLFLGYRPGERLIERIHERRRQRLAWRRAKSVVLPLESSRSAELIRRVLAFDLSMRPPPASFFS